MNDKVHLYVDLANIWAGAQAVATELGDPRWSVRLSAEGLKSVMAANREVVGTTLVANVGVPEPVRRHFEAQFKVSTVDFGPSFGREQSADELLQVDMLLDLFRFEPGVLVLATGDGAGWAQGRGFTQALIAARRRGFGIEVVSFRSTLNPRLRLLAENSGRLVELDPYYRSITFLEGLRSREGVNLRHRPMAEPHLWTAGESEAIRKIFGSAPSGLAA
jgi:hypothetical protein